MQGVVMAYVEKDPGFLGFARNDTKPKSDAGGREAAKRRRWH